MASASVAPSVTDPPANGVNDSPEGPNKHDDDDQGKLEKRLRKEKKKVKRRDSLKSAKSHVTHESETSKSGKTSRASSSKGAKAEKKKRSRSSAPPVTQNSLKHKGGNSDVADELDRQRKLQSSLRLSQNGDSTAGTTTEEPKDDGNEKKTTSKTIDSTANASDPPNFRMVERKTTATPQPDPPNFRVIPLKDKEGNETMWKSVPSKSKMAWEKEMAEEKRKKEELEATKRVKPVTPNVKRSRSTAARINLDKKGAPSRGKSPTKRSVSSNGTKVDKKEKRQKSPKRGSSPRRIMSGEKKGERINSPRKSTTKDDGEEETEHNRAHPKPAKVPPKTFSGDSRENKKEDSHARTQSESQDLSGDNGKGSGLNSDDGDEPNQAEDLNKRSEPQDTSVALDTDEGKTTIRVKPPSQRHLKQGEDTSKVSEQSDPSQLDPTDGTTNPDISSKPQREENNNNGDPPSQNDLSRGEKIVQSPKALVNPPSQRHLEEDDAGRFEPAQPPGPPGTKGDAKKSPSSSSRKHSKRPTGKRDKTKNVEESERQTLSPTRSSSSEKPYLQLDIAAFEVMKDVAPPISDEHDDKSQTEPSPKRGLNRLADKGGGGRNNKASDAAFRASTGGLGLFKNMGASDRSMSLDDDDDDDESLAAAPLPHALDIRVMSSQSDFEAGSSNKDMELWGGTSLDLGFAREMLMEAAPQTADADDRESASLLPEEPPVVRRSLLRSLTSSDRSLLSNSSDPVISNDFRSAPLLGLPSGDASTEPQSRDQSKPARKNFWKKIKSGFGGNRGKKDRQKAAATQIQTAWRSRKAQIELQKKQEAVIKIQSLFRGVRARHRLQKRHHKRGKQSKAKGSRTPKPKKRKRIKSKGAPSATEVSASA